MSRVAHRVSLCTLFSFVASGEFVLKPDWIPDLIENLTSTVDVQGDLLFVEQRWGPHLVVLNATDGSFIRRFNDSAISAGHGVRVHGKDVWVTDAGRPMDLGLKGESVIEYTLKGRVKQILGTPGFPGTSLAPLQFGSATDIAFSRNGDTLFIADGEEIMMPGGEIPPVNNRVLMLRLVQNKWQLFKTIGGNGSRPGEFFIPHALAVDSCDRLWVNDRNNSRVQVFRGDGSFIQEWTCMRPLHPAGLALVSNPAGTSGYVLVGGDRDLVAMPFTQDCSSAGLSDLGDCRIIDHHRVVTHDGAAGQVHSVATSADGQDVYVVVIEDAIMKQQLLKFRWDKSKLADAKVIV